MSDWSAVKTLRIQREFKVKPFLVRRFMWKVKWKNNSANIVLNPVPTLGTFQLHDVCMNANIRTDELFSLASLCKERIVSSCNCKVLVQFANEWNWIIKWEEKNIRMGKRAYVTDIVDTTWRKDRREVCYVENVYGNDTDLVNLGHTVCVRLRKNDGDCWGSLKPKSTQWRLFLFIFLSSFNYLFLAFLSLSSSCFVTKKRLGFWYVAELISYAYI